MGEKEECKTKINLHELILNIFSYGHRSWNSEKFIYNKNYADPSQQQLLKQQEMERQRLMVEDAKTKLLARFPFYAANLMTSQPEPEPVPPPPSLPPSLQNILSIPVPPTPDHQRNFDPVTDFSSDFC